MRRLGAVVVGGFLALAGVQPAAASVVAKVDLGEQQMQVYVDGRLRYSWPVSSGRRGDEPPTGNYRPQRMERAGSSSQYDDAPMRYSIFFRGGYAIHGGYGRLGRPASHGCIRLSTSNAATLFRLVEQRGSSRMRIEIID